MLNIWYFHIFCYTWSPFIQLWIVNNGEKRSFWSKMFNFKGWEDVYNIRVKTGFYTESDSCGLNICCQSHFLKFHSFFINSTKFIKRNAGVTHSSQMLKCAYLEWSVFLIRYSTNQITAIITYCKLWAITSGKTPNSDPKLLVSHTKKVDF